MLSISPFVILKLTFCNLRTYILQFGCHNTANAVWLLREMEEDVYFWGVVSMPPMGFISYLQIAVNYYAVLILLI